MNMQMTKEIDSPTRRMCQKCGKIYWAFSRQWQCVDCWQKEQIFKLNRDICNIEKERYIKQQPLNA
jgi:hypothetical protein